MAEVKTELPNIIPSSTENEFEKLRMEREKISSDLNDEVKEGIKEVDRHLLKPEEIKILKWLEKPGDVREILTDLCSLDSILYEKYREKIAKAGGIRVSILDAEVGKLIPFTSNEQSEKFIAFENPIPSDQPVDGVILLIRISTFIQKYVDLPKSAAEAIAVWIICTWLRAEFFFAPILAILSPTKRSGKTLILDLLKIIVSRPLSTSGVGITTAVIFRANEKFKPTILIDEAEKLASDNESREIIGLLNAGYRKGSCVQRCIGDKFEIQSFDAFGFRTVAAVGGLWDTLIDRAVVIQMKRKTPQVQTARFSSRVAEKEGQILARQIARWVMDNKKFVGPFEEDSPRPPFLNDRGCDNWAPLFAVAMAAGGLWLTRLLNASRFLQNVQNDDESRGERLVLDIKDIFKRENDPPSLESQFVVDALNDIETSPWAEYRKGKGLSVVRLANMLKPFEIKPQQYWSDRTKRRGYFFKDFIDAFSRYISPTSR